MSTSEIKTTAGAAEGEQPPQAARLLLLGAGAALLVGALALLLSGETSGRPVGRLAVAAFLAGIFSFLSPCTLPILPAYFAFTFQARRERIVLMTVAFFLGLATTMVAVGASATAISQVLFVNMQAITLVGGLLVIGFGVMSLLGKGFTGAKLLDRPTASVAGSYLYGATFALGWTACVGPILGALLTLLATQGVAVLQGAALAFIYALGLGAPLILVATFFNRLGGGSRFWQIMRGRSVEVSLGFTRLHLHSTSVASGLLLIVMGALLASGQLALISEWTRQTPLAQWAFQIEQSIDRLFFGQ